jgi:hypothetical protein
VKEGPDRAAAQAKRMSASRLVTLGVWIPLSAASLWLYARYAGVLGPNSAHFMPHGYCYLWDPRIVWLHVISDGLIAAAYYCIPIILIYFIRKNRSLPLNKIFWMDPNMQISTVVSMIGSCVIKVSTFAPCLAPLDCKRKPVAMRKPYLRRKRVGN